MEILFIIFFGYLRRMKSERLQKAAGVAASMAKEVIALDQAKQALPVLTK